jgi:hypothetical protein
MMARATRGPLDGWITTALGAISATGRRSTRSSYLSRAAQRSSRPPSTAPTLGDALELVRLTGSASELMHRGASDILVGPRIGLLCEASS